MARRLVWSFRAADDVDAIRGYLERSSSSYSKRFIIRLRDATRKLVEYPERGRRVPEYPQSDLREIFVDSFRVFYRVGDQEVVIVAIFHMAMDIGRIAAMPDTNG